LLQPLSRENDFEMGEKLICVQDRVISQATRPGILAMEPPGTMKNWQWFFLNQIHFLKGRKVGKNWK